MTRHRHQWGLEVDCAFLGENPLEYSIYSCATYPCIAIKVVQIRGGKSQTTIIKDLKETA